MRVGHVRSGGAVLLVVAALVAGCGTPVGSETTSPSQSQANGLQIGALMPQTGGLNVFGGPMGGAIEMAVDDINQAGGVNGEPVSLTIRDTGTNPQTAQALAEDFVGQSVSAIIGPVDTTEVLAVAPAVTEAGIVQCSNVANTRRFRAYSDTGRFFVATAFLGLEGGLLARRLLADGHKTATTVTKNNQFAQDVASEFAREFRAGGGRIIDEIVTDPAATTLAAEAQQALAGKPQAIVVGENPPHAALLLKEWIAAGSSPSRLPTYGTSNLASGGLPALVDPADPRAVDGLVVVSPQLPPADFTRRLAPFVPEGSSPAYTGEAYNCAMMIALAAQAAKSDDPAQVAEQMVAVTNGDKRCATFTACRDLLARGESVHYVGPYGTLRLTSSGQQVSNTYVFEEYVDGKLVPEPRVHTVR